MDSLCGMHAIKSGTKHAASGAWWVVDRTTTGRGRAMGCELWTLNVGQLVTLGCDCQDCETRIKFGMAVDCRSACKPWLWELSVVDCGFGALIVRFLCEPGSAQGIMCGHGSKCGND